VISHWTFGDAFHCRQKEESPNEVNAAQTELEEPSVERAVHGRGPPAARREGDKFTQQCAPVSRPHWKGAVRRRRRNWNRKWNWHRDWDWHRDGNGTGTGTGTGTVPGPVPDGGSSGHEVPRREPS